MAVQRFGLGFLVVYIYILQYNTQWPHYVTTTQSTSQSVAQGRLRRGVDYGLWKNLPHTIFPFSHSGFQPMRVGFYMQQTF